MIELKEMDKNEIKGINIPNNVDKVFLINDSIGYAFILNDTINKIYIFIKEQYRGNNYGEKTFWELLKYFDDDLIFEISNNLGIRILKKFGGINIGNTDGISKIVVPICKK